MNKLIHYHYLPILLCIFNAFMATGQESDPLEQLVQPKGSTILEILQELEQTQQISFSYDQRNIPTGKIRLSNEAQPLKSVLESMFESRGMSFKAIGRQVVIYPDPAKKTTINGKIRGADDGEYLPGATVYVEELGQGVVSNAYGFYSLTVPSGNYTLVFSYVGFEANRKPISATWNQTIDIELSIHVEQLTEIVVAAEKANENITNTSISHHKLQIQRIETMPALGGEADVLKGIQFLPGIQTANEGTTGFSVRGGGFDQNLILLDEAPVYNPAHSVGLFSVFNPDALKEVKVYKGGIPARYGGRLSSVVDIKMKEGNDKRLALKGSVGIVGSRLTVEGPVSNKVSVLLSGRYGYVGQTAKTLADWGGISDYDQNAEVDFYDLNAKINVKLSDRDRLYISAYTGDDHFRNDAVFADNTLDWSNQTGTLRWNRALGSRLFANLTFIYSDFDYAYVENHDIRNFKWTANFQQFGSKIDFDYYLSPQHELNFGVALTDHDFAPGNIEPSNESSIIEPFQLDVKRAIESGAYLSHQYKISNNLSAEYGLRFSSFHNIGPGSKYFLNEAGNTIIGSDEVARGEVFNENFRLAPRATLTYLLSPQKSIKASYNRTYQYLHLVSNSSVGLPTDVWLPVDNNIEPRSADQLALGYFANTPTNTYLFTVEAFYKHFGNVIDYKDNADLFLNNNIETEIRTGTGRAWGIEWLVEKKVGRLNGWVAYTLSKVTHQIDGANRDLEYAPRYDKRHNLSVVANYQLSDRWKLAANFSYVSGGGITVPLGFYNAAGRPYNYYSERNAYQLPDFHQLNISGTHSFKNQGRWKSEVTLGVTNLYNRRNHFALYVDHQENARTRLLKMYLFGLMPSINYNFKF